MKTISTLQDIEFNAYKALAVVEADKDLSGIFRDDIKTDYALLRPMAQTNTLPDNVSKILKNLFEKVILTQKALISIYQKVEVAKKERKLPRRYGKVQLMEDIKKNGGKKTDLQRAMLSINELRNIYVNLLARCIKDYIGEAGLMSASECRDIVATVETVKKKLKPVLSKK